MQYFRIDGLHVLEENCLKNLSYLEITMSKILDSFCCKLSGASPDVIDHLARGMTKLPLFFCNLFNPFVCFPLPFSSLIPLLVITTHGHEPFSFFPPLKDVFSKSFHDLGRRPSNTSELRRLEFSLKCYFKSINESNKMWISTQVYFLYQYIENSVRKPQYCYQIQEVWRCKVPL